MIPYEIIQHILELSCNLMKQNIWYPTINASTGTIRYRFNKHTENRDIIAIDHMLRFKKKNPPRFHDVTIGFYILDGVTYPCVEYTLSKETSGRNFIVTREPYHKTYSLSRKYIIISKENDTVDYIYIDTQYDLEERQRNNYIHSAKRSGWIIRNDDENYDYDSINEIMGYKTKYNEPWEIETHGKKTHKYDIHSWNWEYSEQEIPGSDYDDFWEDPTIYDVDYACLSYNWKSENLFVNGYSYDIGSFGKFVRYDQLEMDTIEIIW